MSVSTIEFLPYELLKISALKTTLEAMPDSGMQYSYLVPQLVTILDTLALDCDQTELKLNNEHFSDSDSCLDSLVIYLDFANRSTERLSDEAVGKMDAIIIQFQKWWVGYLRIKEIKKVRSERKPMSKPFQI